MPLTTFALVSPPTQSNDAKLLTFTDASATWVTQEPYPTPGGNVVNITITIKTFDETMYFNPVVFTGPYVSQGELIYEIDCSDLILTSSGAALGTADDMLPDGIYDITYELIDSGEAVLNTYTTTIVVLGQIEIDMANDFADVPHNWRRKELSLQSDEVLALILPIQKLAYKESISAEPFEARETAILNIIDELTNLIDDN